MENFYNIDGWNFRKTKEDSYGNCYYNIIHPSGRYWDYDHLFHSYSEMVEYTISR